MLVWVTRTVAINPRNVSGVFHGTTGHVEVHLVGGDTRAFVEADLTEHGRALLCPAPQMQEQAVAENPAKSMNMIAMTSLFWVLPVHHQGRSAGHVLHRSAHRPSVTAIARSVAAPVPFGTNGVGAPLLAGESDLCRSASSKRVPGFTVQRPVNENARGLEREP